MKLKERRKQEKEERRELIRKSGYTVFYKNSFYKVSMQEIADRAALGKSTLYYYYKNKEEILVDIMYHKLLAVRKKAAAAAALENDFYHKLHAVGQIYLDFITSNLFLIHPLQRDKQRFEKKCRPLIGQLFRETLTKIPAVLARYLRIYSRQEGLPLDIPLLIKMLSFQIMGSAHYQKIINDRNHKVIKEHFSRAASIIYAGMKLKNNI